MSNSDELQNRPKPFSKERTQFLIGRIVFFYSIFYVLIRIFSGFQHDAVLPYVLISVPFVILAIIGIKFEKQKHYPWIYGIVGVLIMSLIRFYEEDIAQYMLTYLIKK